MDLMTPEHQITHYDARPERVKLVAFAALMLLAGAALAAVGGPPRLPAELPRWGQVVATLSGSTLPLEPLALLLLDLAWLLWTWIVGSLCLELFVVLAEVTAHGAAWVGSLRNVAHRLSLPVVRRAVAAAFAMQVLSRGVSVAAAQPITPAETALVDHAYAESAATRTTPAREASDAPTYLVHPGDTLWSISERAYGSGVHYRRLIDANLGRRMPDGLVFSAQGVIQPGWYLLVPDAMPEMEEVDGQRWYTVRTGDTLSAIAARLLGDEARWSDLFDLNNGATSPDGSHAFVDADVIWPGLRLCLPADRTPVDGADASAESGTPTDEGVPVDTSAVDLMVASAAAANTAPAAAEIPAPQISVDASPGETDLPPLLRASHAQEPVVLEPSDTAGAQEASMPAGGDMSPLTQELAFAPFALGGLGLAAAAGVAMGVRRMRRLRPLPQEPESEVVVEGGFAEAQLAQDFTRGIHGVGFDPVAALAQQVEKFLHEYNLTNPGVVALRHGRSTTTITLKASLAEQPILLDLAPVLAERLQAEADAWVSADQDVAVRLSRLRRTRLLPTADALLESPCIVPLGVLYDRQVYSATWNSVGHVLVASLPGHGADTILTSLVATLTARRSPEELHVWIVGSSRSLPAPMFDLPHLARVVDPTDTAALQQAAADLRAELDRRRAGLQQSAEDLQAELDRHDGLQPAAEDLQPGFDRREELHGTRADLVLVVPELTSLGEHAAAFDLLVSREADLGVRLVAATTCPEDALASPLLAHFGTRMVLRMQEEEASVALLGVADAAFLGGGGRLLLRLDGREPVELYGYQVPPEHLERLVRVMRSAYPSGSHSVAATVMPPDQQRLVTPGGAEPDDLSAAPATQAAQSAAFGVARQMENLVTIGDVQPAHAAAAGVSKPAAAGLAPPSPGEPADVASTGDVQPVDRAADGATGTVKSLSEEVTGTSPGVTQTHLEPVAVARPPIEVICFGAPHVLCGGVQVWPRLPGGEAKPWELLLYLACQPAEGVSSEDAVEALWPEDDSADDPPHRFRQLRYRLRRALADVPGAPDVDGICLDRGVLRLDPGVVYSDAQEFLSLVRSARITPGLEAIDYLERARALYLGDLLHGPDARRYAWVDERDPSGVTLREHIRRLYQQASARLADLYASIKEVDAALDLYRELTEIDPGDERLWLALFRLHVDRGDRLGLVREERRMRTALRELAVEVDEQGGVQQLNDPSRETALEYQRLLASLHDREREPATA